MEKKIYEEPTVQMVEFDFNECIAASNPDMSNCSSGGDHGGGDPGC